MRTEQSDDAAYEGFRRLFSSLVPLQADEWAAITRHLRPSRLARAACLVSEGDRDSPVAFVRQGVLRHSTIRDGAEHVIGFDFEGEVAGDFGSFFDGAPAVRTVTAVEASDVLVLSRQSYQELARRVPALDEVRTLVAEQLLAGSQARVAEMQQYSPEERYRRLLERSPRVLRRVPLYLVASYLGVSPETLSRIRRRIV